MSLVEDTNDFTYKGPLASRIACCFGSAERPIICTLLGDQPLFYIDDAESAMADELLNEVALYDDLAKTPGVTGKLAKMESASRHIDGYAGEDMDAAFDRAAGQLNTAATLDLGALYAGLIRSRFAQSLLTDIEARGVTMKLSAQVDRAVYDRASRTILINPYQDLEFAQLQTVMALRQAWLHFKGALIHPLHLDPENAILLNRVQMVDGLIAVLRTAWEMNLNGDRAMWSRIVSSTGYDMASSFGREAISDFRALNNGEAARAAFEKWFFSGRCRMTDRQLIQSMLADHHGIVFDAKTLTATLSHEVIARTGEMPVGKNYLSPIVDMILADPLFTEVRDRSNANFLWFIKFEKSFRVSEQGLQEQGSMGYPVSYTAPAQADTSEDANRATVIAFPSSHAKPARKKAGGKVGATVFYIDHFFGL